MPFLESLKNCFSKFSNFSGRSIRSECWWFVAFFVTGSLCFAIMDLIIFSEVEFLGPFASPLLGLFILVTALPLVSVAVRRLHDVGRSGLLAVLAFVLMILLYLAVSLLVALARAAGAGQEGGSLILGLVVFTVLAGLIFVATSIAFFWYASRPSQRGVNAWGRRPRTLDEL